LTNFIICINVGHQYLFKAVFMKGDFESFDVQFESDDDGAQSLVINKVAICNCRGTLRDFLECAHSAEIKVPTPNPNLPGLENLNGMEGRRRLEQLNTFKRQCAFSGLDGICDEIVEGEQKE